MGTVDCRKALMIRFESGAGLLPYQGGWWGPPIRFPGNPTYHSGITAVLRPGEYHRVTPAPKAYSGLTIQARNTFHAEAFPPSHITCHLAL
ncbi:MAG: hypothetical protein KF888_12255 [Nitrosomonas sp.]|nr:hypothetical protein [Nitrosomonas sp.]